MAAKLPEWGTEVDSGRRLGCPGCVVVRDSGRYSGSGARGRWVAEPRALLRGVAARDMSSGEGRKWSKTTRCGDDGESAVDNDEDGRSGTTMEAVRAGRQWGWQ